jgi:ankyrin repeat protein
MGVQSRRLILGIGTLSAVLAGQLLVGCRRSPPASGNDALFEAIRKTDAAAARSALDQGADINARNLSGRTPLMMAAVTRNLELVKTLLARKADVNATDSTGMTALMWAAFGGDPAIVQALLDAGADAKARDFNDETARQWAAKENAGVLRLLRKAGAGK